MKRDDELLTTVELENILKNSKDITRTLERHNNCMKETTPAECIKCIIAKSGMKNSTFLKNLNLSKSYFYEIIRGQKLPSRDVFLQILIASECGLDFSQETLAECGYRNSIIIHAMAKSLSLVKTNILLDSLGFEPLC